MAASSSCMFLSILFLAFVSPGGSWYFDITRHLPHPWVYNVEGDTEVFMQTLNKPWIAVDQHALAKTLANTEGYKIASAILEQEQCSLTSLLEVDVIYKDGTKLFIPNCNGITVYIRPVENETGIVENYPGIIDEIRSGRRHVVKQLVKKVTRFDIGGNVSVSHPFIYSNEEGAVLVHGADKGFEAMESQISNLSLRGPFKYEENGGREGEVFRGVGGFESVDFPLTKGEEERLKKLSMKIEMAIVANIVPTPKSFDYGDLDTAAIAEFEQWDMPYRMTMLYSLHF